MNTDVNNNSVGPRKFVPPVVPDDSDEKAIEVAAEIGAFMSMSAYTLALRDPALFQAHMLDEPRKPN